MTGSLPACVARHRHERPHAVAFSDAGGGAIRLGYAAFLDRCAGFAAALRARGMRPSERVAIVLPNRIEAAVAVYGCWMAGGIAVPLNAQARARDLVPWLAHCGASHLVHEAGHADALVALSALERAPHAWPIDPCRDGGGLVPAAPGADDGSPAADPHADAMILYTSGTTAAPKGVVLTHANLLANARAVVAYLALSADDAVLGTLPFHYAYGASVLHTHLLAGARIALAGEAMFPHLLMEAAARERVTGLSGVPATFSLLLDRLSPAGYDLSCLRYLTQAGGPMSIALAARVRAAFPQARLYLMYGQTEATSRLTWLPPARLADKPGSVGVPVDGMELRIARADGGDAAPGEEGEIRVRGPGVMRGYWRAPAATAEVLRDGWLCTGDIGRRDEEGFVFLSGRRSDMIKTGAHRVHPHDVEEVIAEVPGVAENAVVGVDDDALGQVVKAFVVCHAAPADPLPVSRAIKAHCRARLAPYKVPRHIEFVATLPRTASGKVRRASLLETPAP